MFLPDVAATICVLGKRPFTLRIIYAPLYLTFLPPTPPASDIFPINTKRLEHDVSAGHPNHGSGCKKSLVIFAPPPPCGESKE